MHYIQLINNDKHLPHKWCIGIPVVNILLLGYAYLRWIPSSAGNDRKHMTQRHFRLHPMLQTLDFLRFLELSIDSNNRVYKS